MPYRDNSCTTSDRFVRILDLREGNEESSEETTGCKASVYEEFDDCTRAEMFVKLFDFRHFERFFRFEQSNKNCKCNSTNSTEYKRAGRGSS